MSDLAIAVAVAWLLVIAAGAGRLRGYVASRAEARVARAWADGFRAGLNAARTDVTLDELRTELRFEGYDPEGRP